MVTDDDGIRPNTNLQTLGKLKPAFKQGGSTTAGNSSQVNSAVRHWILMIFYFLKCITKVSDGAAAVLLGSRKAAREHGLPVLATLRSVAVVGVPPDVMGIGDLSVFISVIIIS